jgi:PAS domain S-box-containing protein
MGEELRILILEDVPADAELMERELRKGGIKFSSKRVETREDFLKELKEFAPDIILSDYKLPHFDGMAALEITKELAPTIPFILVTGSMNEETAVECMKAGAADYVIKDHLARIGPAVEGALENKRVREEKARLEEALWTAAREWRATFDALNDPLALMDPEGKIRRCNEAMANLLGKGFTEIIGRNCCEIVHGVSGPIEGCPVARLPETRRRETLVLSMNDRWFNIVADPLLDENGNLIGVVHIISDITESKRAEEALRVTHRFLEIANRHTAMNPLLNEFVAELQKFTQCDAVGIRILDKEGNIPYQAYKGFNQRFYESESPLSIKSDQCMCINVIKGVTDPKLSFYSEGGSFYMNGTTRFLATVSEEEKGQTRNVCNQVGYESVALVRIRIGDRILGLIHVADPYENMVPLETVETLEQVAMQMGGVIERLQAEEALRESEKRYRQVIENATEIIYSLDIKGNFIYGNPACLKTTGFSLEELRQYNYQDLIVPEHQKKINGDLYQTVS